MPLDITNDITMQNRVREIIDREDTAFMGNGSINNFVSMATDEFLQQYYSIFEVNQDARDKLESLVKTESQIFFYY